MDCRTFFAEKAALLRLAAPTTFPSTVRNDRSRLVQRVAKARRIASRSSTPGL